STTRCGKTESRLRNNPQGRGQYSRLVEAHCPQLPYFADKLTRCSRYDRRLGDGTLISARTNCVKKRETSNDVEAGPVARPVFLLSLLHEGTSYLDLTRKWLNPFGRIFGDCSKWNERPISDRPRVSGCRLTI